MKVLGIDCGTERTGYGVIETDGRRHQLVSYGVVRTKPSDALHLRLKGIASELRRVLASCNLDAVAVEEVFHAINAQSALKLAHVRGVALLLAAEAQLPIHEYSPLEVKMSVAGYGRAEKGQVQMMVQSLLGLTAQIESSDAADALAVAICHGTRAAFAAALAGTR
ncbi:MAG TPA: crossover junction endodeoxyribonuclease RuvC [Bryobacteraceae bacterium]|nr:crossover junction endodeoxyribonuclease RuvC [Bryobacteraceae bacterium]